MGIGTPATIELDARKITYTPHPYDHNTLSTDFGREAAHQLGRSEEQVFKTLLATVDDELVVAVVPVAGKLDLKALATALGGKRATLADPALAERRTGYVVGGISPIGQKSQHRTVLDETVELFDTVFVSGGKRGFDIELAPRDLITVTTAIVAAIGRSD